MEREIYIPDNGKLIFTRGSNIIKKDDSWYLIAGNTEIRLEKHLDLTYLRSLINTYEIHPVAKYIDDNNNEIFSVYIDKIFYTGDYIPKLSRFLNELIESIIKHLFEDISIYKDTLEKIPNDIKLGGKKPTNQISASDYEKIFNNLQKDENFYKCIYILDIDNLFSDLLNQILFTTNRTILGSNELSQWLFQKTVNNPIEKPPMRLDRFHWSMINYKIYALFIDTIIGMRSILDLTGKILIDLSKIPKNFNKLIKLESNKKDFNDSRKILNDKFSVHKRDYGYQVLSDIRNSLVHDSSISELPFIFYSKDKIEKADCYLWDHANDHLTYFKNRFRFYSKKNLIDEFIIGYIPKIFEDVYLSLKEIKTEIENVA